MYKIEEISLLSLPSFLGDSDHQKSESAKLPCFRGSHSTPFISMLEQAEWVQTAVCRIKHLDKYPAELESFWEGLDVRSEVSCWGCIIFFFSELFAIQELETNKCRQSMIWEEIYVRFGQERGRLGCTSLTFYLELSILRSLSRYDNVSAYTNS